MSQQVDPLPHTVTIRRALAAAHHRKVCDDLLFLEAWERHASPELADLLRASQIRRANPKLAAALRAELAGAQSARTDRHKQPGQAAPATLD